MDENKERIEAGKRWNDAIAMNLPFKTKSQGQFDLDYVPWGAALKALKTYDPLATYGFFNYYVDPHTGILHEMPRGDTSMGRPYYIDDFGTVNVKAWVECYGIVTEAYRGVWQDSKHPMKLEAYTRQVPGKGGQPYDVFVQACDSFAINAAQMRCLCKAIALQGIGIDRYINVDGAEELMFKEPATEEQIEMVKAGANSFGYGEKQLLNWLESQKIGKFKKFDDLTYEGAEALINMYAYKAEKDREKAAGKSEEAPSQKAKAESAKQEEAKDTEPSAPTKKQIKDLQELIQASGLAEAAVLAGVAKKHPPLAKKLEDLNMTQYQSIIEMLKVRQKKKSAAKPKAS